MGKQKKYLIDLNINARWENLTFKQVVNVTDWLKKCPVKPIE